MRTLLTRTLLGVLFTVAAAATAGAQTSPTPEGTAISNTASASYSDANGNTYTPVTATVSITVGYQAAVTVTAPASQAPVAGSTGNTIPVQIANGGNGADRYSFAVTPSAGVTITGFTLGATTYATIGELNTALAAAAQTAAGANFTITVTYSLASTATGAGSIQFTATSIRQNTVNNSATTTLNPTTQAMVAVTAPGAASYLRGPAARTAVFAVSNPGSAAGDFNFSAVAGAGITITGVAPASQNIAANGGSQNVTVTFTVDAAAAVGAVIPITLTATHATNAAITANAAHQVTVLGPALTITKAVLDAGGNPITEALPNQVVTYRITVTNGSAASAAPASNVVVTDVLHAQLEYVSGAGTSWTVAAAAQTVTATYTGTLAPGASASFDIQARVR
jgi:uncharacterized repeat protein (TIGR01451 family)